MVFIDLIVVSPELHLSAGAETQDNATDGYGYTKDSKGNIRMNKDSKPIKNSNCYFTDLSNITVGNFNSTDTPDAKLCRI